jgi:hypothetical protein
MTLVINSSYEFQVMQTQSSLLKLRSLFREQTIALYGGTKLYRFAVARRYTVFYYAFLKYLVSRLSLDSESESIGMENIITRCRRHNVLTIDDERMVIQMSMLYATFTYHNQGFDGTNDELLKDIPCMCEFVEKFIGFQTIMPVTSAGLEAAL